MTGTTQFFTAYVPCAGNKKVKIVDGTFVLIAGKETICQFSSFNS